MSTTATARRRGTNPRRRNLAGEELIIFGNPSKRKPKMNPDEQTEAVRLFESFSGRKASEILEVQRSATVRRDFAALGSLVALGFDNGGMHGNKLMHNWEKCSHISFADDGVILAGAPPRPDSKARGESRQLYVIGGDQRLDAECLADFGADLEKDLIDLGEVFFVVYDARKWDAKFEPSEYTHEFGYQENGGPQLERPRLVYDRLKRELAFVGGEYFIDFTQGKSPGIEN